MDLNTILIILGIIALVVLVAHGLWANRREKSQYFKNSNTFTRDSRLREPPPQVSTTPPQSPSVSEPATLTQSEPAPEQHAFSFDADPTRQSLATESPFDPYANQQNVERAVENIKISLPNGAQSSYQAQVEPMSQPSSPAFTTIADAENYADQEMGIDTHSEDLRRQLAELAQQAPDIQLSSLQEMPAMEEEPEKQAEVSTVSTTNTSAAQEQNVEQSDFIMLYVVAPENYQFQGAKLAKILDELGFLFGERNIYHRHSDLSVSSPILFSVANIQQPGTFDYNMNDFNTIGIALFMQLPSEGNDLMNLRMMIRAAKSIAEDLGGFVLTDKQEIFDDASEQAYLNRVK
ncbi:cell division protein ZipA [Bisgaard Taxon 46]